MLDQREITSRLLLYFDYMLAGNAMRTSDSASFENDTGFEIVKVGGGKYNDYIKERKNETKVIERTVRHVLLSFARGRRFILILAAGKSQTRTAHRIGWRLSEYKISQSDFTEKFGRKNPVTCIWLRNASSHATK